MKDFKLPLALKIFLTMLVCSMLFSFGSFMYISTTGIFNQTVEYKLEYKAVEQNQVTSFDNDYLAFKEKFTIADINKETFLNVTSIIMHARTDGQNLSWKWVQENQQIPYEEFTCFYKELSSFTAQRFAKNSAIETNKQNIVKNHNLLLTTFPGIIYNHFLQIPLMEYKEGFVSIETKTLFHR